jgi:HK97 family phage major capsid protein
MFDREGARKRMREIESEVSAKLNDPNISGAELKSFTDKAIAESEDLGARLEAYSKGLKIRAGSEQGEGEPGAPADGEGDARMKSMRDRGAENLKMYDGLKAAADPKSRRTGRFEFQTEAIGMKAQGFPSMMGEDAFGTTAGVAIGGGTYFLPGTAGPAVQPQFVPGIIELRFYENVIADLFPSFPTTSPVVTYLREASWTNNSFPTNEGATKPISSNTLLRYTEQIGKIANTVKVTDELIADAPMFWALIQNRGSQGVTRQEEVELLAGGGYPSVNGLLPRSTGFTKAQTVTAIPNLAIGNATGSASTTEFVSSVTPGRKLVTVAPTYASGINDHGGQIAEAILNCITDIRFATFFEPTAVVMNPVDFQTVRLSKASTGEYLGGSFFGMSTGQAADKPTSMAVDTGLSLWGKRVVTTPVIPQGFVLIGDFADAGMVLRLGGLQVAITNTDGNDFVQNVWTARFEERVGLLIERPELFVLLQIVSGGS